MTISKLTALINGLINMIDNGAQEDGKLDEYQKGYNEGYKAALNGMLRNCSSNHDDNLESMDKVKGWLIRNGFELVGRRESGDELWRRGEVIVRTTYDEMRVAACCSLAMSCEYEDVEISGGDRLWLGDRASLSPVSEVRK